MNRRSFLRWIGGTAAGAAIAPTLDLERLLWVPGEKTVFLPPISSAATLSIGDVITIEGYFSKNPITGIDTGFLQQFIVTADAHSDSSIINITPAMTNPSAVDKRRVRPAYTHHKSWSTESPWRRA